MKHLKKALLEGMIPLYGLLIVTIVVLIMPFLVDLTVGGSKPDRSDDVSEQREVIMSDEAEWKELLRVAQISAWDWALFEGKPEIAPEAWSHDITVPLEPLSYYLLEVRLDELGPEDSVHLSLPTGYGKKLGIAAVHEGENGIYKDGIVFDSQKEFEMRTEVKVSDYGYESGNTWRFITLHPEVFTENSDGTYSVYCLIKSELRPDYDIEVQTRDLSSWQKSWHKRLTVDLGDTIEIKMTFTNQGKIAADSGEFIVILPKYLKISPEYESTSSTSILTLQDFGGQRVYAVYPPKMRIAPGESYAMIFQAEAIVPLSNWKNGDDDFIRVTFKPDIASNWLRADNIVNVRGVTTSLVNFYQIAYGILGGCFVITIVSIIRRAKKLAESETE